MIQKTENILMEELKEEGFYYSRDLIFNYYNSLITKPFVILTGISGSGKSKIAEIFARLLSEKDNKNYEIIPVKPNWRDSKGLFGYHNLVNDSYSITPLIRLFIRALKDQKNPYFLVLDEMNIAKTEHYFADYLSFIESRSTRTYQLKSLSECTIEELEQHYKFENENYTLSMVAILAAFDLDRLDEYLDLENYRNHKFVERWKTQNSKSNSWTAQFREEFHPGTSGTRLAYRVFEPVNASGKKYRLKDFNSLPEDDRRIVEDLRYKYDTMRFLVDVGEYIYQENIELHNCERCLSSETGKVCNRPCKYFANEKFKCKYLYNKDIEEYFVPPQIPIPINLFTIGTVNVDETTYMFSPKVLDRSNVIEFNEVNFSELYDLSQDMKNILTATNTAFNNEDYFFDKGSIIPDLDITLPSKKDVNIFIHDYPEQYTDLLQIFTILKKYNMQFGYRVMSEISLYVCNVIKNSSYNNRIAVALDLQLLQKVLPKFYGTYDKLWKPLIEILNSILINKSSWGTGIEYEDLINELTKKLNGEKIEGIVLTKIQAENIFIYPRTGIKILNMLNDLYTIGFSTFIK